MLAFKLTQCNKLPLKDVNSQKESLFKSIITGWHTFFFFWLGNAVCGFLVPQRGMEPAPLQRKYRVVTPGPPRKSWTA